MPTLPRVLSRRGLAIAGGLSQCQGAQALTFVTKRGATRGFSSTSIFSDKRKHAQREWAAQRTDAPDYDYFHDEVASRLVDRLRDIKRDFPVALELGARTGSIAKHLCAVGSVHTLYALDNSAAMLRRCVADAQLMDDEKYYLPWTGSAAAQLATQSSSATVAAPEGTPAWAAPGAALEQATLKSIAGSTSLPVRGLHVVPVHAKPPSDRSYTAEDATTLPFPDASMDAVLANCSIQWVNDVPALLSEVRRVLKPDGVFIGAIVGGETLDELRQALTIADLERRGGVTPRVSPMMHMADAGGLMHGAGFKLITVDVDSLAAGYAHPALLMQHLQNMGENNAVAASHAGASRDVLLAAAAAYHALSPVERHGADTDVVASAKVIYVIGWAPAASQQQPKQRGSATENLKELGHITSDDVLR